MPLVPQTTTRETWSRTSGTLLTMLPSYAHWPEQTLDEEEKKRVIDICCDMLLVHLQEIEATCFMEAFSDGKDRISSP